MKAGSENGLLPRYRAAGEVIPMKRREVAPLRSTRRTAVSECQGSRSHNLSGGGHPEDRLAGPVAALSGSST